MSREIRVGLIGCGVISAAHLDAWSRVPGCRLVGVFDLDRELAASRAASFGAGRVYDTPEALVPDCDVVDVCTPPHTHTELARLVLAAGRHLLIEKPLVTAAREWEELRSLAATPGAGITVVHNLKFTRGIELAHRAVERGAIGEVIRFERLFLTAPAADRMLVGDRHWSHRLPGGRWFETLPHELYLLHHLVGPLDVAGVTVLSTPAAPAGAPADEVVVTLRGEACLATLHYSANCLLNQRSLTLHGSRGSIEIDFPSDSARLQTLRDARWLRPVGVPFLNAARALLRFVPDRTRYLARRLGRSTPHRRLILALARHLRGDGPPPTPLDEIDYVVRGSDRIAREIQRRLEEASPGAGAP